QPHALVCCAARYHRCQPDPGGGGGQRPKDDGSLAALGSGERLPMVDPLLGAFPGLAKGGYTITSPPNKDYNCIAWTAGDAGNWWWPAPPDVKEVFWPAGVLREEAVAAFREAFASLGYVECAGADLEPTFEKIALFASESGVPLHAARQR